MRLLGLIAIYCALLNLSSSRPLDHWMAPPPHPRTYAFVDVSVIPMTAERTIMGQTVIVHDGKIVAISDNAKITIPDDAEKINGRGLYLMPGLSDMHFHLHNEADALLLLSNGVTTIRNMRGTLLHLIWKQSAAAGRLLLPSIYTCGPILDGNPPTGENVEVVDNPDEAVKDVAEVKRDGFDCVKIYNRLSATNFAAITSAAKQYNLPVVGHVPSAVGLQNVLNARLSSIEHLTGYMTALRAGGNEIHEEMIPALAKATRQAGVWNCVTLIIQQKLAQADQASRLLNAPEMRFVAPLRLAMWNPQRDVRFQSMDSHDFSAATRGIEYLRKITKALSKEGAGILVGTDAPSRFVVPGFSVHEELEDLVIAGLTPYQALKAATRDAAEFLGGLSQFGTIEVGKRADLVLVEGNPLRNIQNTRRLEGVMVRGIWLPKEKLRELQNAIVASYSLPEDRFASLPELGEGRHFEYRIQFDGLDAGAERFAVSEHKDGTSSIVSQVITYPPFQAGYLISADLQHVRINSSRPEGSVEMDVSIENGIQGVHTDPPLPVEFDDPGSRVVPGTVLLAETVAGKFLLGQKLRTLNMGESLKIAFSSIDPAIFATRTTEIQNYGTRISRLPNDGPIRVFSMEWEWNHQKQTAILKLDGGGIPVFYQQGLRTFMRVR